MPSILCSFSCNMITWGFPSVGLPCLQQEWAASLLPWRVVWAELQRGAAALAELHHRQQWRPAAAQLGVGQIFTSLLSFSNVSCI